MSKQTEVLKLALEKVQEFKARWWKVPPFGNKVNKATREAITNAHSPIFELENTIREALAEQPAQQQEPVAWRDHVEQRLLTWRQSFVNKSGDQLALDDFMDKRSLDDMIDFVCSEYTSPPASRPWVPLTEFDIDQIPYSCSHADSRLIAFAIEAKLREKNT